ncbi:MAG: DUF2161 family putative PD-(D/E)XK-type phosphodiesterase [Spirochaetaceae bacterium]|nr:DUF2161 family putative PD-(D/E)XK-type phosphodiesterase [Spirochaetaceae bacterium]
MAKKLRETDLYPPLAAFLEKEGYTVHAEVQGADIAARRGDRLLLVEMKLRFNLDVLLQAAEKQGAADETYVAVPLSGRKRWPPRWSALRELLGRLGLGVFFVRFTQKGPPRVEKILAAENLRLKDKLRKKKTARAGFLREMEGRPANFNTGGSVGKKLVTAYLVKALHTAFLLAGGAPKEEPRGLLARGLRVRGGKKPSSRGRKAVSLEALRKMGAPENCRAILYNNYNKWFRRRGRGLYALSPAGAEALAEYAAVVKELRARLAGEAATAAGSGPEKGLSSS